MKTKDVVAIKEGNITVDELLENYPVKVLVNDLMEIIQNQTKLSGVSFPETPKIVVTEEQFKEFFRIKGFDVNGNPSTRGRKPKQTIKAED